MAVPQRSIIKLCHRGVLLVVIFIAMYNTKRRRLQAYIASSVTFLCLLGGTRPPAFGR